MKEKGQLDHESLDTFPLFLDVGEVTRCLHKDSERIVGNTFGMCILKVALVNEVPEGLSVAEQDLMSSKDALNDDLHVDPLNENCCTLDQGKAVVTCCTKTFRGIVTPIASRGCGKYSAFGLAVAARYSNIYVTAPVLDSFKTLFEFVCKGFDAHDYKYIQPHENEKIPQVELLVIDEAAAIPLPVVKSLFGIYLVLPSGYEGTGRSLSLKLLQQLEEQSRAPVTRVEGSLSGCFSKKIELNEGFRYAFEDPIESWLNGLLCLDVANSLPNPACYSLPSQCGLYYANPEDCLNKQPTQLEHLTPRSSSPNNDSDNQQQESYNNIKYNNDRNQYGRGRGRGRNGNNRGRGRNQQHRNNNSWPSQSLQFRGTNGIIVAAITMATVLLLFTLCGVSAATPILSIQSPDGDVIDCVNKLDQPTLKHPLLKNHIIQETPSDVVKTEEDGFGWQVWHAKGTRCPHGTIPIRRFENNVSHTKYPLVPDAAERATKGHQYAIGYMNNQLFYGTKATINVWKPIVESADDFSLAQIWLRSGHYRTNDLNTIEAGWQVYPDRYQDHQPRLFTYWTRDAYLTTGCYSTSCVGFVHVSSLIALEAAISRTSTFGGEQFDITIQIWKDIFSGNWWMGMGVNVVPVGYWPAEIFTTLSDHATEVQWGGEVLYRNSSGMNSTTQMGSGKYPDKGFRKAGYFCNLQIAEENHTFLPVQNLSIGATQPNFYTIKKAHSKGCGTHFYYGGPGPIRSASVTRRPFFFDFLVFVIFLVI